MKKTIITIVLCILCALSIVFSIKVRYSNDSLGDMKAPDTEPIATEDISIETEGAAASSEEATTSVIETTAPETVEETVVVTTEEATVYVAPETIPPQITIDPYANLHYIWDFLDENYGWSDATKAGIIGNIIIECSWSLEIKDEDIYAKNPNEGGYGICQWNSGRKEKLFAMYNTSYPDLAQQLQYMKYEMFGEEGTTCQFISGTWARDELLSTDSPERAALLFAEHFERCHHSTYQNRQDWARLVYEYFTGKN